MALDAGIEVVKFFPAEALGGVPTLKAMSAPFSMVRFIPTGGIGPEKLLEYLALPVLQLLAAGLNFGMMIVASRPAFPLPFKTLKEVTDTRDILASFHLTARKQPSV